tara:strand:- start:1572 stop:2828 length:1257 start_codon:yes stop_codon:yes gene_type:complete
MKNYISSILILSLIGCGGGGSDNGVEVIQNNPPSITNSSLNYEVEENQELAFIIEASDPDGDDIAFEVSGPDENSFFINDDRQVLFLTVPDYENPSDVNQDNLFEISIKAFDGSLYSQNYEFTISITDDETDNSSASCTQQTASTSYCTIDSDNLEREFYVVFPESFTLEKTYPLIISLHGGGDYADANMEYTGFKEINDQNDLVLIFPQGTVAQDKGDTGWFAGGDCSELEVCDISFIEKLIDFSIEELAIDSDRIYVSGFSNGAFMAYTTACFLSNKVAAVAPVSGSLSPEDYESCAPERPLPIIHLHGLDDSAIPVQGSDYVTPLQLVSNYWSSFNLCSESIIIDGDDSNGDGYSWYSEISTNCQEGVSLNFTYLENFGHSWPTSESNKGGGADIEGASFIWEFLSLYDLNGLIN